MHIKKDIAIIGGGPAGLAAGLYAARAGRSCIILEAMFPGGQMTRTESIANYPGSGDPIDGFSLAERMERQAKAMGAELAYESVTGMELDGSDKLIHCGDKTYEVKAVIIATGASPRKLGLADEDRLTGAGVSYCATCDGAFFRDKAVAVVGGGDTAVSDALYLARFASKVYIVHRRNEFRAAPSITALLDKNPAIEKVLGFVPEALIGGDKLSGLAVKSAGEGSDETRLLDIDGLFVAVGISPNTELFKGHVALDAQNRIITDRSMKTDIPGVYAAGDVRDTPLRQVVTAVADGAVAATSAVEYIIANE